MMTERKIFNQYNFWFFLLKNTVLAHKGTSFAGAHRFIFLLCFERLFMGYRLYLRTTNNTC